jgi:hypothetical protein
MREELNDHKIEEFVYKGKTHRHLIRQQAQFKCTRIGDNGEWIIVPMGKETSIVTATYLDREIPKTPNPHKIPYISAVIPLGLDGIYAVIDKWKKEMSYDLSSFIEQHNSKEQQIVDKLKSLLVG